MELVPTNNFLHIGSAQVAKIYISSESERDNGRLKGKLEESSEEEVNDKNCKEQQSKTYCNEICENSNFSNLIKDSNQKDYIMIVPDKNNISLKSKTNQPTHNLKAKVINNESNKESNKDKSKEMYTGNITEGNKGLHKKTNKENITNSISRGRSQNLIKNVINGKNEHLPESRLKIQKNIQSTIDRSQACTKYVYKSLRDIITVKNENEISKNARKNIQFSNNKESKKERLINENLKSPDIENINQKTNSNLNSHKKSKDKLRYRQELSKNNQRINEASAKKISSNNKGIHNFSVNKEYDYCITQDINKGSNTNVSTKIVKTMINSPLNYSLASNSDMSLIKEILPDRDKINTNQICNTEGGMKHKFGKKNQHSTRHKNPVNTSTVILLPQSQVLTPGRTFEYKTQSSNKEFIYNNNNESLRNSWINKLMNSTGGSQNNICELTQGNLAHNYVDLLSKLRKKYNKQFKNLKIDKADILNLKIHKLLSNPIFIASSSREKSSKVIEVISSIINDYKFTKKLLKKQKLFEKNEVLQKYNELKTKNKSSSEQS